MAESEQKYVTPARLLVDAILSLAFFVLMFVVLQSHVPSNDPFWIYFWSAATAACMTGVFWLCIHMFRVVLIAQRAARRNK